MKTDAYNLMNDDDTTTSTVIDLSQYFSWINPFIFWLPMWTQPRSSATPSKCSTALHCMRIPFAAVPVFILMAVLFRLSIKIWWNMLSSEDISYKSMYILYEVVLTIARGLSLYYFYFIFDHHAWMSLMQNCAHYDNCCIDARIKKYNRFLKLCLILMVCIGTGDVLMREIQYEPAGTGMYYMWTFIIDPICLVCIYWPMFISMLLASTIFIKYHCYILYLLNALQIDKKNNDFKSIFEIYEQILDKFKQEYHFSLKYSVLLYLANIVLDLWIFSFEFWGTNDGWQMNIVWTLGWATSIIMFVMCSSLISESFEQYQCALIKKGKDFLAEDDTDAKWYHYLVIYTMKNPFEIKLGDISITKWNAINFAIGFVVARLLAYSYSLILQ